MGWVVPLVLLAAACTASGGTGTGAAPSASQPSSTASPPSTGSPSAPASASPSSTSTPPAASFRATDVSFVSARRGWTIGAGRLLRTTDGGLTWTALPAPPPHAAHVRFATTRVGYAWQVGGRLWTTTDGGTTWRHGGLARVVSLEAAAGTTWALAGEQPYPFVWRASVGSTHWTRLGYTPNRTGTLDVHGAVAYVMGETGAGPIPPSFTVWAGDRRARNEHLPCVHDHLYVPASPLGVSTDGTVVLVCVIQLSSRQTMRAYLSHDLGQHWTSTSPPPEPPTDVTAVPGRLFAWGKNLLVQQDGRWRRSLAGPASGEGFVLVGFEDATHGLALGADGVLHMTSDAGTTWRTVTF
jgi:hypothetical protein